MTPQVCEHMEAHSVCIHYMTVQHINPSVCPSVRPPTVYPSIPPSIYLSNMHLFILTSALFHLSVDHVTPQPGESLLEAFECWQEAADKKACCDYSLHVDIPQWNEAVKDELELLVHEKGTSLFHPAQFLFQTCVHPNVGTVSEEQWGQIQKQFGPQLNPLIWNSGWKSVVLITMLPWWCCRHFTCNLLTMGLK